MSKIQDSPDEDPMPLEGGRTHVGVIRVGSTIRRPTGPWTPGVHALLRHLEARGFQSSPRVLGIDSDEREILTFVPGEVVWPDHLDLIERDAALGAIARWVRAFHDHVTGFDSDDYAWSNRSRDPSAQADILCHNDLSAWNLVRSPDGWIFIDWDLAAPGRRLWDIAWALLTLVPFGPDSRLDDERIANRIRVFCESYGSDLVTRDVIQVAHERAAQEAGRIRVLGGSGQAPYARLLAEGHLEVWSGIEKNIADRAEAWSDKAFNAL